MAASRAVRRTSRERAGRGLFGTDGVRGLANGEVLTPELAVALARSAAHELLARREGGGRPAW